MSSFVVLPYFCRILNSDFEKNSIMYSQKLKSFNSKTFLLYKTLNSAFETKI